jgi:cysteine synthase A
VEIKRASAKILVMQRYQPVFSSILDLIGNTPILELAKIRGRFALEGRMLAKLEHLNPGGSKKDRVALAMIRAAAASGKLSPGQPVVEVTSGNTGSGLAVVCRAMGYPFYAVMSAGNSRERAQMMRALGAEVVLVEQAPGSVPGQMFGADMKLVRDRAAHLIKELGAFFCDQFENPANAAAHVDGTAVELWEQSGGKLDAIVAFVGSGGALGGMATYLRAQKPDLRVYAVEPASSTSLACCCCSDAAHGIQGGGYGKARLSLMEGIEVTEHLKCSDEAAAAGARLLALDEGILAGYSTGAQMHCAIDLMKTRERGSTVAFLVCDSGMKYLSTGLYP